ncbi:alpha/beta-hydrolase [Trichodelitschia bisporula]|uniref:Alpha/beta-hydrolase n=1 Tax=Trichodelitschia bisporula TaxID=703511 RepID=A0A6G1HSQ3_9PEZI|nr:alpha/beta-hydrolase [Trichodelitschia bisporula]
MRALLALTLPFAALASCPSGLINSGEPSGSVRTLGGVRTYMSPAPNNASTHAILFLPDIFGIDVPASRLVADSMARAGYLVAMPDILLGDPRTAVPAPGFNQTAWSARHTPQATDGVIEAAVKGLRDMGVKQIGAVGYCFGGRYVVRFLAKGRGVDAGFLAHPSGVEKGEWESVSGAVSVAAAETDSAFPAAKRHEAEDVLKGKAVPYQVTLYSGVEHGFAVRGEVTDKKKRFAKEGAFLQAIRWFDEWVKA